MSNAQMRHAIMRNVKANGLEVSGDFWLMLIFRTGRELRSICREMNIRTVA